MPEAATGAGIFNPTLITVQNKSAGRCDILRIVQSNTGKYIPRVTLSLDRQRGGAVTWSKAWAFVDRDGFWKLGLGKGLLQVCSADVAALGANGDLKVLHRSDNASSSG